MAKPRRKARTRTWSFPSCSRPCVSFLSSSRMSSISLAESRAVGGARTNSGCGAVSSTYASVSASNPSRASSSNFLAFFSMSFSSSAAFFSLASALARSSAAQLGYLSFSARSNSATSALKSPRQWNESRWNASAGKRSFCRICVATSSSENVCGCWDDAAAALSAPAGVCAVVLSRRWSGTNLPRTSASSLAGDARARRASRSLSADS
mmetsp:Transcript_1711/g.6599  ORF Transcript_1711/g.6599 Transcript_1711/m.6599 type:complete len:209 (-) Transcript_1711:98-724(-)